MHPPLKFELSLGGFMGPSYRLRMEMDKIHYEVFSSVYENKAEAWITPSQKDWDTFREAIDDIQIWNWDSNYFEHVIDGSSWSLELEYPDSRVYSEGSNAYPAAPPSKQTGPEMSDLFYQFFEALDGLLDCLHLANQWHEEDEDYDE